MPQLSTGFVIAGAYADKLRRVLFAQLRDKIKAGEIDNRTVAARAGELNRLLFEILVNRLKIDKGDVVRVRIEYDVVDGDIRWKLDTLRIEAFRRIPDEEVAKAVRETLERAEEVLAREVTEEERSWTEAREREVERAVQERAEAARRAAAPETVPGEKFDIAEAAFFGATMAGENIALLRDSKGDNIGLVIAEPLNGSTRLTIILVPGKGEAYRATLTLDQPMDRLRGDPSRIVEAARKAKYIHVSREEAEQVIRSKLSQLQ